MGGAYMAITRDKTTDDLILAGRSSEFGRLARVRTSDGVILSSTTYESDRVPLYLTYAPGTAMYPESGIVIHEADVNGLFKKVHLASYSHTENKALSTVGGSLNAATIKGVSVESSSGDFVSINSNKITSVLVDADKVKTSPVPFGRAWNSTGATIPSGTGWTKVALAPSTVTGDLFFYNPNIYTDASMFEIQRDGLYLINGSIRWPSNATGHRGVAIWTNGTASGGVYGWNPPSASAMSTAVTTVMRLSAGETVEMRAYQNSGASLKTQTDSTFATFLEVAYMGS